MCEEEGRVSENVKLSEGERVRKPILCRLGKRRGDVEDNVGHFRVTERETIGGDLDIRLAEVPIGPPARRDRKDSAPMELHNCSI